MRLATSTRRPRLGLLAAAALAALVSMRAAAQIDLGDVTAGGDGSGNAPGGNIGIDPRNGAFVQVGNQNTIQETDAGSDGLNPSPTTTDFVDSVFFIGPEAALDPFPQAITQTGIEFEFPLADAIGTGYNYIMSNEGADAEVPIVAGERQLLGSLWT